MYDEWNGNGRLKSVVVFLICFIFFIETCIESIGLSISDILFFTVDSSCFESIISIRYT